MAPATAGDRVGSYTLVRRLGHGGMGEVWLGEHVEIKSQVAIKLVLDGGDDRLEARFLREARAVARIRHPGIVAVSDYGQRPQGGAYLVMELLEGETLADRLARGALSVPLTVAIGLQLSEALAAAHSSGVVHRDLKPSNVFLTPDSAAQASVRVKLVDFGVAKDAGQVDASATTTGALVGTPFYMAPEQCSARIGAVDHRADLYALGVVLYEALSGVPPFRGPTLGDLIDQHLNVTPRSLATIAPATPERLAHLVMRLLAKLPRDRPASASDVARELERISPTASAPSAHELASTRPATSGAVGTLETLAGPSAATPPRRRNRWWIAMAGVTALFGVVAAVRYVRVRRDSRPSVTAASSIAELERACTASDAEACQLAGRRELRSAAPDRAKAFGLLLKACDRGLQPSCVSIARMFAAGIGVRPDPARARTLVEAACTAGERTGCAIASELWMGGVGGFADAAIARARAVRACELGDPQGCTSASRMLSRGIGGVPDKALAATLGAKARPLAQTLCDRDDARACTMLAELWLDDELGPTDPVRSVQPYERGCELGEAAACGRAAHAYSIGKGIAVSAERASSLYERGCNGGDGESCEEWAIALHKGSLGASDSKRAVEIARRTCETMGDRYCTALGYFYQEGAGVPQDLVLALDLMQRGCDAGLPLSCIGATRIEIPNQPPDEAKRFANLERACALAEPLGCTYAAMALEKRGDVTSAAKRYDQACLMSRSEYGCDGLALLYFTGQGVPRDPARGKQLLEDACAAKGARACRVLAERLRDGVDTPKQPAEALRMFERACDLHNGLSCKQAAEMLSGPEHGLTPDAERAKTFRERACRENATYCPTK
jgi:TPR repeat protein/tRNA A-37 threonylcarbamoyl transferase component Bud32